MFSKKITPFTCIIISLLVFAVTFVGVNANRAVMENAEINEHRGDVAELDSIAGNNKAELIKLAKILSYIEEDYVKEYNKADLWNNIYRIVAMSIGDDHALYLTSQEYESLMGSSDGNFVGIGVRVAYYSDLKGMYVFNTITGSPAQTSGIVAGDVIVAVDGVRYTDDNYNQVTDSVLGEPGTTVKVTVSRDGAEFDLDITRALVDSENVIYKKLDNGIAYICIYSFADFTLTTQFTKVISLAQSEGCNKFIFDVRNNTGGYLDSVCEILDMLLPEGVIINIVEKGNVTSTIDSDANCINTNGMVVLCNETTASASELFAAALRDYNVAELVGTQTFGKGTMQTTYPLENGDYIKFSTAFYNPPSNVSYDGVGITPNYVIEIPEEWKSNFYRMPAEEDTQLQKAIELLNSTN